MTYEFYGVETTLEILPPYWVFNISAGDNCFGNAPYSVELVGTVARALPTQPEASDWYFGQESYGSCVYTEFIAPTPSPAPATLAPQPSSGPTPNPTEPPAGGGSQPCFPGDATVELENGLRVAMHDLQLGDRIRTADASFSEVYLFGHRMPDATADYLRIITDLDDASSLRLSPGHYLPIDGVLKPAKEIRLHSVLTLGDGRKATVAAVVLEAARGVYSPITLQGDLVVDGVLVSSYTQALRPAVAHVLLAPVRAIYRLMRWNVFGAYFEVDRPWSWAASRIFFGSSK